MDTSKIRIGDRITFKAATRDSYRKATRVVTGLYRCFNGAVRFEVRYNGWDNFQVFAKEILSVDKAKK